MLDPGKNNSIWLNISVLTAIVFLGIALYLTPLHSTSFYFDDNNSIVNNEAVKTIDLPKIFNAFNTRSLVGLSFAVNYSWWGLHPQGFRLTNLLIHCFSAFLVFLLVKTTLYLYSVRKPIFSCRLEWPALFASLLFLCHPIQTEPVNFVTQRFVLMGSFFYLAALFLFIKSRSLGERSEAIFYYICSLITAVAAMFCKEFVVTLPLMITLYDFYFLASSREKLWKRCGRLLPFFAIVLIVPVLLSMTSINAVGVARIAQASVVQHGDQERVISHIDITRAGGSFGREKYFLTELNVVCTYIRLLFVPVHQDLDYDYPLADGIDNKTALCGFFLLCLLGLAVFTYKNYRIISFSILWFFIALSVESSFIPIGHVIAEYRLYLASVGFVFMLTTLIYTRQVDVRILNVIAAIILVGLSVLTYQRNKVWKDEASLWDDTIKKSPHKARPYNNRGNIYLDQGNLTQALSYYNKAIEVDPSYAQPYNNRGVIYAKQKKFDLAILDYNKAIELDPSFERFFYNRGFIYSQKGNFTQAISDYKEAIIRNSKYLEAYSGRASAYAQQGDLTDAMSDYNKSIELAPKAAEPYNDRGSVYDKQGNLNQAMSDYNKAIELDPKFAEAYYNRSYVYGSEGDFTRALIDCNKAIELDPKYAEAYYNRGIIYARQRKFAQALSDFNKTIEINPKYEAAYGKRSAINNFLKPKPKIRLVKNTPVIDRKKSESDILNNLVRLHYSQGDFTQAAADFTKLIQLNANDAVAYFNRGSIYDKQGDFTDAVLDYSKVIELNLAYAGAYYSRGVIYARQGNLPQAMSDYNKAIGLNLKSAEIYTNRGIIYAEQNKFTQAMADYNKAIEINPNYAEAYYNQAVSYYQLKEYDNAWGNVHKAEEFGYVMNPNFINALKQVSGRDK